MEAASCRKTARPLHRSGPSTAQVPTITCPPCKCEIKLTESLAAPLIQATRREFEARLTRKDAEVVKKEALLREREAALRARYPGCVVMSARREGDIAMLREAIAAFFQRDLVEAELFENGPPRLTDDGRWMFFTRRVTEGDVWLATLN